VRKSVTGCRLEGRFLIFQPATFQRVIFLLLFLVGCQPHRTATLALLGDLVLGRGVNVKPDSLAFLTPELDSADLALANLESPLSATVPVGGSPYNLCASSGHASLLSDWSFDLLSIANNHTFDCDPNGPSETRAALEAAGITPVGPGMQPVYRDVNGLRLAFLKKAPWPERLMLVGHEPDCGALIAALVGDPNGDYTLKNAGVAALKCEFEAGGMVLRWTVAPKDIL
jgi:hypothetical protein